MKWPSVTIMTPDGPKSAIAPVIISASRSTDIPAFHSKWFADRLKAGYCRWVNPFSRRPQYVSFENVRAIVFWTKNAAPILPILRDLDARGITYYFQFTVNGGKHQGVALFLKPGYVRCGLLADVDALSLHQGDVAHGNSAPSYGCCDPASLYDLRVLHGVERGLADLLQNCFCKGVTRLSFNAGQVSQGSIHALPVVNLFRD